MLELLRLREELALLPACEFALRERTARLANFRHTCFTRVRRIDRTAAPDARLIVVSEHVPGTRLSEILADTERHGLDLDINAALCLLRQLLGAVALLHENVRSVAHGALGPDRVVVTADARVVVVEHVLGSALERLELTRERLWRDFTIAVPPSAGVPRFDQRADVTQVGLTALSLVFGRPLRTEEFPLRDPGTGRHGDRAARPR